MFQDRYQDILRIVRDKNVTSVKELAQNLYISESTIRRDVRKLETQGALRRRYGKVSLLEDVGKTLPVEMRMQMMPDAKKKVGRIARSLVDNGDVILIDSSSTCLHLVEELDVFEDLTVITYGLRALNLLEGMHVTVYCLGGRLYRNSKAFVGDITEATLQRIQVDKCFFSMSGISEDGIMSDAGEAENILHRMMLKQNAKKICLVDSSKIATRSMFRIGEISDIDYIISDVDIYTLIKKPVDGKIPTFILAQ